MLAERPNSVDPVELSQSVIFYYHCNSVIEDARRRGCNNSATANAVIDGGYTEIRDSRGFKIDVKSKHGVTSIRCESRYYSGSTVRDFQGKTDKGIGMGADWDHVEKAYGKSDSIPRMPQELRYEKIGLSFGFTGRKLTSIGAWRWSKDYDVWIIPAGNGFLSAGTAP